MYLWQHCVRCALKVRAVGWFSAQALRLLFENIITQVLRKHCSQIDDASGIYDTVQHTCVHTYIHVNISLASRTILCCNVCTCVGVCVSVCKCVCRCARARVCVCMCVCSLLKFNKNIILQLHITYFTVPYLLHV